MLPTKRVHRWAVIKESGECGGAGIQDKAAKRHQPAILASLQSQNTSGVPVDR